MALRKNLGKCDGCIYCRTEMISVAGEMDLFYKCYNGRFNTKKDEPWERPNAGCPSGWSDCLGRKENAED